MQTNKTLSKDGELYKAAERLLAAAYDYWSIYQKECGSCAVVWLENDEEHFLLFTRGEYRDAILRTARIETRDAPRMFAPFGN